MDKTRLAQTSFSGELICELSAIRLNDRQRYHQLWARLLTAHISSKTINHGYALELNEEQISMEDVSEWIRLEGLCCSWLDLNVKRATAHTLQLRMTAPNRARAVLRMELGELLVHQSSSQEE